MIDKAIKAINPNAEFIIVEDNLDNIEWLNGTTPISKSDIEAKISELAEVAADKTAKDARVAAQTIATNKKASGKQKLKDLGLDDDEIKALIGA